MCHNSRTYQRVLKQQNKVVIRAHLQLGHTHERILGSAEKTDGLTFVLMKVKFRFEKTNIKGAGKRSS